MIVGTAGHIDHGKTTLVRALTGVDTDRLKEEKARGISIELGYAYTPLPDGSVLGFIDVPGHEKLVHTMAAGASGIDFGLLVVAADDGVMPQTREHLAILRLLGVPRGAVALTKCDRADAARIAAVHGEIAALVQGGFLEGAPVFEVAAQHADDPGTQALRAALHGQAQALAAPAAEGLFRLAVDRAFTLAGHGTVVTGTVHDGRAHAGDDGADLRLMPAGTPVRVRSIHAQNQPSPTGQAGQRCALNLPGIDKQAISRGDWIADARCFTPSRHVDVALTLLPGDDTRVRPWTPLHVHIGAARHLAHAVPLAPEQLEAGQTGLVQLVFDTDVCAMPGDRCIVRNPQATRTLGGGRVLDANAPDRKRRSPARLHWLTAVGDYLDGAGLRPLLEQAPLGLTQDAVQHLTGQAAAAIAAPDGALWVAPRVGGTPTLIAHARWAALLAQLADTLDAFHASNPDEAGIDAARLRRMALPGADDALWQALVEGAQAQGLAQRNGPWLHRPGHAVTLSDDESVLAQRLLPDLEHGAFDPPWVRDLARQHEVPEERVRQLLRKLLRRGDVAQVVRDLFYHRLAVRRMAQLVRQLCETQGGAEAAAFRDLTGLGRKRAVQVLEFFDRVGYTRRLRDLHVMRGAADMFERGD
ncbi:selenocysteine-specific translation elongation factor [Bordetella genomosp. 1]|uniref:Selenocysteine-specific elongation factor n=1 Tax=Bordetella genomosp. 1 TaxID=1395607 RepID=A0ABX4F4N5_9BORD|nr:selenocysteine-specific translation elongation factor [Bordetella genomosp. 1]OZI68703.1 selenocysteine-specific translation elongation factor [Bordetella genomosp. 1]